MTLSTKATPGTLERHGNPALVLPAVLRELYFGRRTGLLYVEHDPDRVSFRFVNGEVVSGSASSERGRLGETMVRYGLLARPDLDRALEVVNKEGRRLGPVLRELGVIEAPRLEQALSLHIREMLITALRWEEAYHVFEQEELPELPREDLTLRSSTGELILELVRSITSMDTVRQGLGDIDQFLVAVKDPPFRLERITLTPADGYLLSRMDGKSTARTIIGITPLPKEEVERSLLGLLCTGVVEYRSQSSSPPQPGAGTTAPVLAVAPSPPAVPAPAPPVQNRGSSAPSANARPRAPELQKPASPPARASAKDVRNPSATVAPGLIPSAPRLAADPEALAQAVIAAEANLAEGRFRDALVSLEAIVPMAEGALERRARLLLVRCYGMSPEGGRKAESELLRLVRLDPRDAEALFALGKFYQANSLASRARSLFQKVVDLQPGHRAAAAELAALPPPSSGSAGLLDRFRRQAG